MQQHDLIELELLDFLTRQAAAASKSQKRRPSSSAVNFNNSVTLQDCEDWIVFDKLHAQAMNNSSSNSSGDREQESMTQRALYYSLPFLYRGDYNRCISHINRLVAKIQKQRNEEEQQQKKNNDDDDDDDAAAESFPQNLTKLDIGISATGKALIFGPLQFSVSHNSSSSNATRFVDVGTEPTGHVITSNDGATCTAFRFPTAACQRIFVVEKEAIARQLVTMSVSGNNNKNQDLLTSLNAALICIKGFPCEASRSFLQRLALQLQKHHQQGHPHQQPTTRIFYVGDCDPHGVSILLTLCGLNNSNSAAAVGPLHQHISWIALKPSTVVNSGSQQRFPASVPWNLSDTRCIKGVSSTLQRHHAPASNNALCASLLNEVQLMEAHKLKLELEALSIEQLVDILKRES